MWWKKSTQAEPRWDPAVLAVLDRVETRLDRLEALVRDTHAARSAQIQVPTIRQPTVAEWMPVLDRMHEIALVAMGHPDLAQQFGLTGRQREAVWAEGPTKWTEPEEPTPEGTIYG